MNNDTELEFVDISSELYREYDFVDKVIRIDHPTHLHVSDNGHRLLDSSMVSYYIPYGWVCLTWESKKDCPNFVK